MPARITVKSLSLSLSLSLLLFACAPQATPADPPQNTPTPGTNLVLSPAQLQDTVILSMQENGFAHLFAYIPGKLSYTRLTAGDWSDITPSLSPDGKQLAFASNRNGFWDIYTLDLSTGETHQITNTPEYDASPTWSPDSAWIAYESYRNDNLEIIIHSLNDSSQEDIPLTEDSAADYSPVWLPNGRQIVFASNRSGNADIWIANLDVTDETRFKNLSSTGDAEESHPAISPDGKYIAWASLYQTVGYSGIYILDAADAARPPRWAGDGSWPAWNAKSDELVAILNGPNQQYLTSYAIDGKLLLPPDPLPGYARGLLWSVGKLDDAHLNPATKVLLDEK